MGGLLCKCRRILYSPETTANQMIKRYDIGYSEWGAYIGEKENGHYVLFSDHIAKVAELEAELAKEIKNINTAIETITRTTNQVSELARNNVYLMAVTEVLEAKLDNAIARLK